jgi:hypothetical protein
VEEELLLPLSSMLLQVQISTGALLLSSGFPALFVVRTMTGIPGEGVNPAWAREAQQGGGERGGEGGGDRGEGEGGGAASEVAVGVGAGVTTGATTSSCSAFSFGGEAARATGDSRRAARATSRTPWRIVGGG